MLHFEVDESYLAMIRFDPREEVSSWLAIDSMHRVMLSIARGLGSARYRIKAVLDRAGAIHSEPRDLRKGLSLALEGVTPRLPYYDWELLEDTLSAGPLRVTVQYMDSLPQDRAVEPVRWYDSTRTPCRSSTVGELCEMLRYTGGSLEKTIAMAREAHDIYMQTRDSILPRETGYNPALPVRAQSMVPAAWRSMFMRGKVPELTAFFRGKPSGLDEEEYYRMQLRGAGYYCLVRDTKRNNPLFRNKTDR